MQARHLKRAKPALQAQPVATKPTAGRRLRTRRRQSRQPLATTKRSISLFGKDKNPLQFKTTSANDGLVYRNPFMKHKESIPDLPLSQLPEDSVNPTYRKLLRENTDRIITVRQNNAEPYSYTHQLLAAHSVDPVHFGESAAQLIMPSRLVLDGPGGLEALAYYDHSIAIPRAVDPDISELKAYARTLLLDFQKPPLDPIQFPEQDWFSPDKGLRDMQRSKVPASFHSSTFLTNTHLGFKHDLNHSKTVYSGHIAYAETSTALKNIGFWNIEAGSADQVVGQHYALPGMVVATTSPNVLGYVAALGGLSHKVSPVEAAALIAGQPVQAFQPSDPVKINLYGPLAQWVAPHDVATLIIQYLGETAFHNIVSGTVQPLAIELNDNGNQFSIDELASICSTVGALPNVATITVPPNATQRKYLRDTNRGAYSQLLVEYGPQLLEPDHKAEPSDTVHINLSQIIPQVSVHAASVHNLTTPAPSNLNIAPAPPPTGTTTQAQALNTVSCPLDYLDAITGVNPAKRLNLAKLTHIKNFTHHPALHIEKFHEANSLQKTFADNPSTKAPQQVLPNRYKYIGDKADTAGKLKKALDRTVEGTPLEKIINPADDADTQTKKNKQITAGAPFVADPTPTSGTNDSHKHKSLFGMRPPSSTPATPSDPNAVSLNDGSYSRLFAEAEATSPTPTHQRQVDNSLTPPSDTVGLRPKTAIAGGASAGTQTTPAPRLHPQQSRLRAQQHQQAASSQNFWPQTPNIVFIRGGFVEMTKAIRVMVQCMSEGMKPKVDTVCLQFDSKQAFDLVKCDPTLIDSSGTHFLDRCQDLGITVLAPGGGNIDAIVSKVVLQEAARLTEEQAQKDPKLIVAKSGTKTPSAPTPPPAIDPRDLHPTILTTDITLAIQDGGLGHYTPHLFSSSHEHTALTAFTGQLGYDPINSTLSPQTGSHSPDDPDSFFVLPARGVEPSIDPASNKLVSRLPSGRQFYDSSRVAPAESLPSALLSTEYSLRTRIDLNNPEHNSRFLESRPVKTLPSFHEIESALGTSPYNRTVVTSAQFLEPTDIRFKPGSVQDLAEGTTTLHESLNLRLRPPTRLGYKRRTKIVDPTAPTDPDMTKRFVQLVNETNHQQTVYPAQWWDNNDIMNVPVICNANLPTAAADIAGLNSTLRLTPVQQFVAKQGLRQWIDDNLLFSKPTSPTAAAADPEVVDPARTSDAVSLADVFTDLVHRRLQTTPRHLRTLFPFHQPHLQLRYGLSGLRSTHTGAQPQFGKPEFVAATQPLAATATGLPASGSPSTTSSVGVALGIRLAQLKEILRASQWGSFLLPLVPREIEGIGAPDASQADPYFHTFGAKPSSTVLPSPASGDDATTDPATQKMPSPTKATAILRNHFAEETNLLWTTTPNHVAQTFGEYRPIVTPNPRSGKNNEFISNLMPAVRTFLKLPSNSVPGSSGGAGGSSAHAQHPGRYTQALINPTTTATAASHQSIQSIAWNYFAGEQKWVLIGDGSLSTQLSHDPQFRAQDLDDQFRWDGRGFGFGTVEECDAAAQTLKLLGCQAVLATKFHHGMTRALKAHGILGLQFNEPFDSSRFGINDTVSLMTHHQPEAPPDEVEDQSVAGEDPSAPEEEVKASEASARQRTSKGPKPPRVELFLPNKTPMVILHSNGNAGATQMGRGAVTSEVIPVTGAYDPHALVWFRAGSAANAGVEYQMRKSLVDRVDQLPPLHLRE